MPGLLRIIIVIAAIYLIATARRRARAAAPADSAPAIAAPAPTAAATDVIFLLTTGAFREAAIFVGPSTYVGMGHYSPGETVDAQRDPLVTTSSQKLLMPVTGIVRQSTEDFLHLRVNTSELGPVQSLAHRAFGPLIGAVEHKRVEFATRAERAAVFAIACLLLALIVAFQQLTLSFGLQMLAVLSIPSAIGAAVAVHARRVLRGHPSDLIARLARENVRLAAVDYKAELLAEINGSVHLQQALRLFGFHSIEWTVAQLDFRNHHLHSLAAAGFARVAESARIDAYERLHDLVRRHPAALADNELRQIALRPTNPNARLSLRRRGPASYTHRSAYGSGFRYGHVASVGGHLL